MLARHRNDNVYSAHSYYSKKFLVFQSYSPRFNLVVDQYVVYGFIFVFKSL